MPIHQALARVIRSKDLFRFFVRRLQPELIFDVGSRDGRDALSFREAAPLARIIACEGNPSLAQAMRDDAQLAAARIEVEHCAAGAAEGTGQFFVFNEQRGTGSLLPRVPGEGAVHAEIAVPVRRLDTLPRVQLAETVALWIDVEGCAYEVLEGARGILSHVILIHVEVESREFWKDQKLASDVQALLAQYGFAPVYERNKRGKGQGNIIFLKREMAERRDVARDIVRFEIRTGVQRLFGSWTRPAA